MHSSSPLIVDLLVEPERHGDATALFIVVACARPPRHFVRPIRCAEHERSRSCTRRSAPPAAASRISSWRRSAAVRAHDGRPASKGVWPTARVDRRRDPRPTQPSAVRGSSCRLSFPRSPTISSIPSIHERSSAGRARQHRLVRVVVIVLRGYWCASPALGIVAGRDLGRLRQHRPPSQARDGVPRGGVRD